MVGAKTLATGTPQLLCSVAGGGATVTRNRPDQRNALSDPLTRAVRAVLPVLEAHTEVRGVVITGVGSAFCAGGEVAQMGGTRAIGGAAASACLPRLRLECVEEPSNVEQARSPASATLI